MPELSVIRLVCGVVADDGRPFEPGAEGVIVDVGRSADGAEVGYTVEFFVGDASRPTGGTWHLATVPAVEVDVVRRWIPQAESARDSHE